MRARDMISSITYEPNATGETWLNLSTNRFPSEVSWSEFLVLAIQHRVAGIAYDALRVLGWQDRIAATIHNELVYACEATELYHAELCEALQQLADADPASVSRAVLLKGATMYPRYSKAYHRPMSDFDILVSEKDFSRLEPVFDSLGYWKKESLNGPTYYRKSRNAPGNLCMDVHVLGPSKYHRPDSAITMDWLDSSEPYDHAGIACRRLRSDFEFINLVTHAHEHLASWLHVTDDDDIRLIRFLDMELFLDTTPLDTQSVWEVALELDLHGEFALGLWAWARIRGSLPEGITSLAPLVEVVDEVGELCAIPDGRLAHWEVPVAERAFLIERGSLAFDLLPEGLYTPGTPKRWQRWHDWYMHRSTSVTAGRENVELIAERARALIAEFSLSGA
jgi:hypothetical protein